MRRNKHQRYFLKQISILILYVMTASSAWAFGFIINESQVNNVLALTFPYKTQIGGSAITLSNPHPHFYETSQEVGITLNISFKDQASGQTVKAKAMLRGGIKFDNKQQQLQLIKPRIDSLEWADKSISDNKNLIDQVSQLVGQDLPLIVLLDIKQLTGDAFTPTLSSIKVKQQGIEINF
jgi:hypothetical protein